ncbi:MAG: class II glutamine amidotransferase [Alphaproteobacteria bacterium]|nr:class II glutamine amidotransferase [Alphaproteobacteria bacterium]
MCRLYGFHATESTRVECNLVHAQNSLLKQGIQDAEGLSHGNGWGLGVFTDGLPVVERRSWAIWHGEHFAESAARISSRTVISHVRRATVGPPAMENTHPFCDGRWVFAHNGTIPKFSMVKPRLLEEIAPRHRDQIAGVTDSEHVFRYFLSLLEREPDRPPHDVLHDCVSNVIDLCAAVDPQIMPALNLLVSDGKTMFGSRLGRTLWFLERREAAICEYCGIAHVQHGSHKPYRAIEVASEPITHEEWRHAPNASIFCCAPDLENINFRLIENRHLDAWRKD